MALAFGTFGTVQINRELVPAQPDKIIRVLKLMITTWASVKVTLVSDPESDPLDLHPPLHIGVGSGMVVPLGRRFALVTGRGKALGFSASFQAGAGEYSVTVWYEVVT
jgi:hypothetical protein